MMEILTRLVGRLGLAHQALFRALTVHLTGVFLAAALFALFALEYGLARADVDRGGVEVAAVFQLPQLPGLSGQVDWRQWDSFFTYVVKRFGQDLDVDLRALLAEAFLDSRYQLTSVIAPSLGRDPVPELFLDGWKRLSPILRKALPGLAQQTADRYATFISTADKLASGSQVGLLQLSPDVLRGMAGILEPAIAIDPLTYTVNVDAGLRSLLGFGAPLPISVPSPPKRQSRLPRLLRPSDVQYASFSSFPLVERAQAAEPDVSKLNRWVPETADLQAYLTEVKTLLLRLSEQVAGKSDTIDQHKILYRQIVLAAGWQESCWRQFVKKGKALVPLASSTGDLGLMQVNRNTWRGVYDAKGLADDIEYNGSAGGEILLHYLVRYAIKKNEDKQPGGNLARATYAAYNGGPSHLARYRAAKQNVALKKVDQAFWEKFQAVSSGREMEVRQCYQK